MSADNYVIVKRFGKNDYRWGMWFASDDDPDFSDVKFKYGPFETASKAAEDAVEWCDGVIEYGIDFDESCLRED
jgi:hypothetical protein